ncbi:MAG: DUF4386 domain-containing protein [Candidatus Methanoperedens sp.]|nr:DUF4386 domain-containing protein [Candidatus Methanoperedens sp.]
MVINTSDMNSDRKTAIIVGGLYIIGTVSGMLFRMVFTRSIHNDLNLLTEVAANENQIVIGAFFLLLMGLALAMVPVMMFPILRKHNEALAVGYVVFRGALETVTTIAMVIGWLFLTILGQHYIAGAPDASYFQTLGTLTLEGDVSIRIISQFVFPLGALMFYWVLYQAKLIPRWISGWGLISAILVLVFAFLNLFDIVAVKDIFDISIFLQEMVMAVWLIFKGFNPSLNASEPAKV